MAAEINMERVSIEDVENNPNGFMRRIEAGESFEITRDGKVFATASPPKATGETAIKTPAKQPLPHK